MRVVTRQALHAGFVGSGIWRVSARSSRRERQVGQDVAKRIWTARAQDEVTEIVSIKNRRVKEARGLLLRRQRDKTNRILLEGQRLISDAVEAGITPLEVFYTNETAERNGRVHELLERLSRLGTKKFAVSDAVIRALSDTVTPQVRFGLRFTAAYIGE